MMISKTAQHALRAVLFLAKGGNDELVRVDDIASGLDVPRNYLSKILHALARARVLESARGPAGGFRLTSAPDQVSVADVVELFDPPTDPVCLLGGGDCSERAPCAAHQRWRAVQDEMQMFLRGTTMAELLRKGTRT